MLGAAGKRVLVVVALAALAAGVVLLLRRRATDETPRSADPPRAGDARAAAARGPAPLSGARVDPVVAGSGRMAVERPPLPVIDAGRVGELPPPSPQAVADVQEAHAHLQDAARTCAAGKTLRGNDFVRFRYTLVIAAGEATVEALEPVDVTAPEEVARCVFQALEQASWDDDGQERTSTVDDHLEMAELQ